MYSFNDEGILVVKDCIDIREFCEDTQISREEFNQPVIIAEGSKDCSQMFHGFSKFNQPIVIPEGVEKCIEMLSGCTEFNQPLDIPSSVTDCSGMLTWCENLNQPVTMHEGLVNCSGMFEACLRFNQKIEIPSTVKECTGMLVRCRSYNQHTVVPSTVERCSEMFSECVSLKEVVEVYAENIQPENTFNCCPGVFAKAEHKYIPTDTFNYFHGMVGYFMGECGVPTENEDEVIKFAEDIKASLSHDRFIDMTDEDWYFAVRDHASRLGKLVTFDIHRLEADFKKHGVMSEDDMQFVGRAVLRSIPDCLKQGGDVTDLIAKFLPTYFGK